MRLSDLWKVPPPLLEPALAARPLEDPPDVVDRDEPTALATALAELIQARQAALSLDDALRMPPVRRGVDLIVSIAAGFVPVAYGPDGRPLEAQPMVVTKPDPNSSRHQFISDCVWSLLADGDLVLQRLGPGARVLPMSEVNIAWDDRMILRRYSWRGTDLEATSVRHIAIGRRPGQLRGSGPLMQCLASLAPIKAAEDYATAFFAAGGVPEVVLKVAGALTEDEADILKQRWIDSRVGPDPAVLSGGASADFPAIDPQKAQMQETRAYGATIVSRMLGIPGALLHVETSGATITYTNPAGAIEELVKATILPLYLRPLEDVLSELAGADVRFDTDELARVDIAGRATIDGGLVTAGILTAEEVRPRWTEART